MIVVLPELLPPATPMTKGRGGTGARSVLLGTPENLREGVLVNHLKGGQAVHVISERQQAMLDFERTFWTFDEPKETLIRARFQCSADEYYSELNELLERPEALDHDPLVVRRLQRQRLRRRRELLDTGEDAQGGAQR